MCDIVSSMYNEEDLYPDIRNYESNKLANSVANSDRTLQGAPEGSFCSPLWDTLSCFPATPVGTIRSIPCMPQIQTVINGETYTTLIDTTSKFLFNRIKEKYNPSKISVRNNRTKNYSNAILVSHILFSNIISKSFLEFLKKNVV